MGLDLHDVKIVNDGYRVKNVFVDGKEMKGITKVTYTEDVESISSVIIEMFVNKLEIEDCNEKETLKEKVKELEEKIKQLENEIYYDKILPYKPYISPKSQYYKYDRIYNYDFDRLYRMEL